MAIAVFVGGVCSSARAETLDVLHWWTSASERKAAVFLERRLAEDGITWRDVAIPGGAGVGAVKVLKTRFLANQPPAVAQLIGPSLAEWAQLGLIVELDEVARAGNWQDHFFPTTWQLVQYKGHVLGVPLGIHRINTLHYNRQIFERLGLRPPRTWKEFDQVVRRLQAAGVTPLGQSSEAWQVATLFETLLLAEGGPAYYRELLVKRNLRAYQDPRLAKALQRLRDLRSAMGPLRERPWTDVARQLAAGEVGMVVMGDWFKGELNALGLSTGDEFSCVPVPETADYHLYSIDTLAMFAVDDKLKPLQFRMAQLLQQPAVQLGFSRLKGSIPVRQDQDIGALDVCSRASWQAFARGSAMQAPSLVHRMASDEPFKDAVVAQIHRFFMDETISVAEVQRRLEAQARALAMEGKK
ncbi:carbohydrate ABC transporter substrate-binding protein [Chitinilyticum litopenaei]|uniref:Probable sugar-binding periplasmic protein n=2 Tax=Chitinilyticum piscinae TaxID=2866724 RepID=A0A8J7FP51_9NEIS|nr:carbohydrate ABC transporter substrate-binding protein [Chitinilyticum piscinae]